MFAGLSTILVPMYVSEIAPLNLRGALGTVNQLAVTIGLCISQILGVDQLLGTNDGWPVLLGKLKGLLFFFSLSVLYLQQTKEKDLFYFFVFFCHLLMSVVCMLKAWRMLSNNVSNSLADSLVPNWLKKNKKKREQAAIVLTSIFSQSTFFLLVFVHCAHI